MGMALDLKQFDCIRLARPEDNERLLELSKAIAMKLDKSLLSYDRGTDFFSFSKQHYDTSLVFCFVNPETDTPEGFGVVNKKKVYLGGHIKTVAYLSDLRALPTMNKKAKKEWPTFLKTIIEKYTTWDPFSDVDEFHCIILDGNRAAEAVLKGRTSPVSLKLLADYKVHSYIMSPFMGLNKSKYNFQKVVDNELADEAYHFMSRINKSKNIGFCVDKKVFSHQSQYVLKVKNKIIASFRLCPPTKDRKIIIKEASRKDRVLSRLVSLTGACKAVKSNSKLSLLYINDICFDENLVFSERQQILKSILLDVYKNKLHKKTHAVSLCCPEAKGLKLMGLLNSVSGGKYYAVSSKGSVAVSAYNMAKPLNLDLSAS